MCRKDKMRVVLMIKRQTLRQCTARCAVAIGLLVLSACDTRDSATFAVKTEGLTASTKADLELCGRNIPMMQLNDAFVASEAVTCEGEAMVRLRFPDGSNLICDVGYVTRGLGNLGTYEVTVVRRKCSVRVLPSQDPG